MHFFFTCFCTILDWCFHNAINHHIVTLKFKLFMHASFVLNSLFSHVLRSHSGELFTYFFHICTRCEDSFRICRCLKNFRKYLTRFLYFSISISIESSLFNLKLRTSPAYIHSYLLVKHLLILLKPTFKGF